MDRRGLIWPRRLRLRHLAYHWQALMVVMVGSFMVMLDTTIVNIGLPKIITVFHAPVDTAQFVLTGYMIALAIVMPATGYLTDTYGTKRIYLLSMLFFTAGSALCGLAWDVPSLVLFRVLQGLGGGMLMPLGMTIIFKTVPPDQRGLVTGVFGLPLLVAPVVGPTLGGYLVEYVDWRVIFTLNIPIGALGLLLGSSLLRETERRLDLAFDRRGFVLSGVGFSMLLYALSQAPDSGWGAPHIVAMLGGGVLLLLLWTDVELTESQPLLELRVFKSTSYALATSVNFIVTAGMFSSMFLLPIFLQNLKGLGAMQTGLIMFPQALAAGVTMPISGRLFDRLGPRPLMIVGLLLMGYATWQLSFLDLSTSDSAIRSVFIIRGLAMGLVTMPAMTVAMNSLPPELVARGSSLTNVLRQLFGAFGTAIFATLLHSRQTFHQAMLAQTLTPDLPGVRMALATVQQALLHQGATLQEAKMGAVVALYNQVAVSSAVRSFDDCFLVAAAICLVGVVPALFLSGKGDTTQRPRDMLFMG